MMLDVAPELSFPEDVATRANALLAMKGAGKSNAAVVMAERMFEAGIPWVAIDPKGDWWGIRASADGRPGGGLPIPIFGGLHADVPIEQTHGAKLADLIVDHHLTCLVDVSEMSKAESIRFLTDFFERLYRRKSKATYPMHLFLEECDDYVPQKVYSAIAGLVRQVELVVKRGRQRGIGITLATQRSASVNKDVLTQTDNLIALRTTAKLDRDAIKGWVEYHSYGAEMIQQLPTLDNGEAWVSSPEHMKLLKKIRFRRRRTFDSGATPQLGEKVKPATLTDIDVAAISAAFADTIEKAQANDPVRLKREVARLEHELARLAAELEERGASPAKEVEVEVKVAVPFVPGVFEESVGRLSAAGDTAAELSKLLVRTAVELGDALKVVAEEQDRFPWADRETPRRSLRETATNSGGIATKSREIAPRATYKEPRASHTTDVDGDLGKAELAFLAVLAQFPAGRTRTQLAMQAGYKKNSTLRNALSKLRSKDYIEDLPGDAVRITDAGADAVGGVGEALTGPALIDHWMAELGKAEQEFFSVLVEAYPDVLSREEAASRTESQYDPTLSTMRNALSKLRGLNLIEDMGRGTLRAKPELFE